MQVYVFDDVHMYVCAYSYVMSPVPFGKKYLLIYVFVLLIFDSLRGPQGSSYHVKHMNFNSLL